jgi:hypothetical protein
MLGLIGEIIHGSDQPVNIHLLPKKTRQLPHISDFCDLERNDRLLLVHRDPLHRFYSAFCDKIIAQRGAENLLTDVGRRIENIEDSTLAEFIADYLSPNPLDVDPHFLPQSSHMFDVKYQDTVAVAELYFWAEQNFGIELANRHFLSKTNSLEDKRYQLPRAHEAKVSELRTRFLETRAFPWPADFFNPEIVSELCQVYDVDNQFFSEL